MAEFKLGRIKFVYQGAWTTGNAYVVDDVVTVGGKTYICVISHTASALFASDLTGGVGITKWNLIADGSQWKGNWSPTTYYNLNDMVLWGGIVYICKTAHTSDTYVSPTYNGLETNQSNWDAFASNFNWSGSWAVSTRYKVRDLVYYGGITYVCNTAHISASTTTLGLENDSGKWDTFNQGINYLGAWTTATRYKVNDVVKYGADLWICTTQHSSSGTNISSNFSIFVNGFEFTNSYNASTAYIVGDVVTYGGYTYTCIQAATGQTPSTATSYWKVFTTGLVYSGAWTSATSYKVGQIVTLGAYSYVATADNSSSQPPSANWSQLNSGIRWNAAPTTTYSAVTSSNVSSSGSGSPKFDVTLTGTAYSVVIHSGNAGTGYAVNDTLKILGTALGGISPANDLIVKVATITGSGTGPIATVSVSSGYAATWKSGMTYVAGDAVYYGNSSYICISAHVGSTGVNDPISDTSATYWNILASGADSGALTTQGDIVYYGANGATRLPIGTDGQVLRVNNNIPAWSYYGQLQNVVYVAQNGSDVSGNGQGLTIDKPWASLLYACKQIEDGYLNVNAGLLLKINKQFMMKEVNNFILNRYSFNVTGTSSSGNTFVVGGSSSTSQVTTANMYLGMPITFSAATGGVTIGQIYYVNTIPTATTFSVSSTYFTTGATGNNLAITANSSTASTATFSYVQSKAERDTSTIIDGIVFDLTHGGNLFVTTSAQAFFLTATSYITNNATYEMTVWIASLEYLENTLLAAVLTNTAPTYNYQTINGVAATSCAIQNTTEVATSAVETGALSTAQNLLDVITSALSAGTYANIPQLQRPHTSIYLKTGTYNEYGPIVVPQDTAILGDELRSTIVQAASAQPYLATDKPKTVAALRRIQNLLPALVSNIPVTTSTGNTSTQSYLNNLTPSSTYSAATQSIVTNNTLIQTILAGGLTSVPGYATSTITTTAASYTALGYGTFTLTTPTGFNTSSLTNTAYACSGNATGDTTGYGYGVTQIANNIAFLQTEIAAYLETYTTGGFSWSSLTATQQGQSLRDVAYLLSSVQYDMTYGGNSQCQVDGLAYFSLAASAVPTTTAATVAALTRLQTIIPFIVTKNTGGWTKSSHNSASQVTTGTAGSTNAGVYAAALIGTVITIINSGSGNSLSEGNASTSVVLPYYGWASSALQTAFTALQAQKTYIQTQIQTFIATQYPNSVTNLALTYRDAGTVVDALTYDMVLGSNYFSMVSGRAFYRFNTSAQTLISSELVPTQTATQYIAYYLTALSNSSGTLPAQTGDLGNPSAVNLVVSNTRIIQDMFSGGGNITGATNSYYPNGIVHQPAISMPAVTGYNTSYLAGYGYGVTQIQNNYQFINDEIVSFLNTDVNLTGSQTWSSYSTTYQAETQRDLANILDAICYDMTYGCNDQSLIAGRAFYSLNSPLLVSPYTKGVTEALSRLSLMMPYIVQATSFQSGVGRSSGNTTSQSQSGSAGSAQAAAFAQARIADILYWINNTGPDTSSATFTGSISSTTLTVSSVTGTIKIGQIVTGGTVAAGTYITAGSGTSWTVSVSQTATATGSTMAITPVVSGAAALATTANLASFNAIQARAQEIQNDAQAWVTRFFQNESPSLVLTNRDAGYIVTALSYDVLFGGNFYSIVNGRAFNRLITSINNVQTKFADATYGAIGFIGERIKLLAANGSVAQTQTVIDEMVAQIYGQPTNNCVFNGTVNGTQLTINSISSGTLITGQLLTGTGITSGTALVSGPTVSITGAYISSTSGVFSLAAPLTTALVVGQQVTISGTFSAGSISGYVSGAVYYVIGSPTTSAFQLSATQGGTAVTTTTGGSSGSPITGITITASPQTWLLNYSQSVSSTTTSIISAASSVTINGVSYNNVLTSGTTTGFVPGLVITISGSTIGNIVAGTYYIKQVLSTTQFTISSTYLGSVFATGTASGTMTAVVYGIYGGLALTTAITASGTNIPVTAVTTSTNLITVASTANMFIGMPIVFSGLPGIITTTATTISSNAITLSSVTGVVVGQKVWFTGYTPQASGSSSSIVANKIYYVQSIVSSTITIAATLGSSAITLTNATGLTMTANFNTAGGLVNGNQYWINTITPGTYPNAGTTITVSTSYKNGTAHAITNSLTRLTAGCVAGLATNQGVANQIMNGTIAPWGNPTNSYQSANGYNNTLSTINGAEIIRLNKSFLAADAVQYVQNTYAGTVVSTNSNGTITCNSAHNFSVGDPVQFSGVIYDGALASSGIYWVLTTPSTTTFTVSTTQPGTGTQSTQILIGGSGSFNVNYYIITAKAQRDATYHIDGLVYDLAITGNYKSLRSAQLYVSAQSGATATDLFHVRNGTGIRNMTLNGLSGSLGLPNALGTRRPTAGAYTSLDPGFGPNDSSTWAFIRSCYIQNVTNFGNAATGLKIDAALHNGGNKSILANDYTQVISDGIGVWCTGHGSLTECVSVFNYYCYTGYLAEYGGRIRATNGNSSYGYYGVIAEGIDSYETPIYATLNNRANSAYVTNVVTDSVNQILRIEFENAGSAYTNALPTINGAGYNAVAVQDEFRDSAVFETRLVDLNNGQGVGGSNYLTASNTAQPPLPGAVPTGTVTIANSDTQLSSAYVGMRIQITAGTGVGQYANILTYTSSSKIANIYRPNYAPLTITVSSTSVFTVASTATMYAGQPIYLGASVAGLTGGTVVYYVTSGFTSTQFSVSDTAAHAIAGTNAYTLSATSATPAVLTGAVIVGTSLTLTSNTNTIFVGMLLTGGAIAANTYIVSGSGLSWTVSVSQNLASTTLTATISVPVYEAGWDHTVPGATVQATLDATSTYIIEPTISYSAPGFTASANTATPLQTSTTWAGLAYGQGTFIATSNATGVATTNYSTNGKTWAAGGNLPTDASAKWGSIVYGGGQSATATATVGGLGGSGAVLQANIGSGITSGQVVSITVVNGGYNYSSPPTIVITDPTGSGATATCEILNGSITIVNIVITGSVYSNPTVTVVTSEVSSITATTWGFGYQSAPTVTLSAPFTTNTSAWSSGGTATNGNYYYYKDVTVSPNVTNYYLATSGGTFGSTGPMFASAVSPSNTTTKSSTGTNGTVSLTYVGTLAVAAANTNTNGAGYGVISYSITQAGYGYTTTPTVTITDPSAAFVAISNATNSAAYSTNQGTSWTATSSNTGKTTLTSLAYGPIGSGTYVAVGGSGSAAAVSLQGNPASVAWSDQSSNITANSSGYKVVAYGNGTFLAIGGTVSSYCTTNPSSWTSAGTMTSKTWVGLTYGNARFIALASDGTLQYNFVTTGLTSTGNPSTPAWVTVNNNPLNASGITTWSNLKYAQGLFVAIATGTQTVATSTNGLDWTLYTGSAGMPSVSNWYGLGFGNPQNTTLGAVPTWLVLSNTSGTISANIATGARPQGRVKIVNNAVTEIRMVEPGSGFARGNITATASTSTGTITTDSIVNLSANQPIVFNGTSAGGITTGTYYYVYGTPTAGTFQISYTAGGSIVPLTAATISGMTYYAGPTVTITDPNSVNKAPVTPRIGNGALGNPSFSNRGTANATATASYSGDGYADLYQTGTFVNVSGLYQIPTAGCNVVFSSITGTSRWYKLVAVTNILGTPGNYTATFQINPGLSTLLAPPHNTLITTNLLYSNVRLTGHDFLYIGTGGFTSTNYPNVDPTKAVQANQTLATGGGRVFFTSTDQDGNFNVGNLFGVQQSTGTATLNASAFNLSGLQSLTLGSVSLGVGSATITQFSTDPYFTANSDSVVPTQKAIKAFITAQIGGGQSSLNVNSLTAGQIQIAGNTIINTTGAQIYVNGKMYFTGGIDGAPVALVFFGQR